ncbi:MAG: lamin tail domain-containing protein [Leadbetterella sp.]|nr:lamin tail domain-containing protein [Leadbetterella sp.]
MKLYLFLCLFITSRFLYAQAVIITEIFADPTPSHGLPEREYLEIFNRSAGPVSLSGYSLTYGMVKTPFPAGVMEPGQYVIVCRNAYVPEFSTLGKVIGLSNLSLNNTGTTLKLSGPGGKETHTVAYSSLWYTAGRSEGYSLEMIDTAWPCRGRANWQSSPAPAGGTPGRPNAAARAHPDLSPPRLLRTDLQENRVMLVFDEVLSPAFAESTGSFEVLSGNTSLTGAAFPDDSHEAVALTLDRSPQGSLELKIYGAEDCSGNAAPDTTVVFESLPEPLPGDIRLSEILFNPLPGGEDFVEIYNTTPRRFNLKNWQLARLNAAGAITGHTVISTMQTVLPGNGYLAFSPDPAFLRAHYPLSGNILEVPALPAYNNDAGTVLLLKPDSTVADRFTYSEKMHAALIRNPKGVSLERVSFQPGREEWASASSDGGFATPGGPNSRGENYLTGSYFSAEPLVFHPDREVTWLTYQLSGGELYAAITVLDRHGRPVKILARNHLLGTRGKIAWDGTDDSGRRLPPGYYVFAADVFGTGQNRRFYSKTVIGAD